LLVVLRRTKAVVQAGRLPVTAEGATNGSVEATNVRTELRMDLLVLTYIDAGLVGCAAVGCRANIKNYGCADVLGLSNLDRSQIDWFE
jgi:hypothetical protein